MKKLIMVVEDDKDIAELLRFILEAEGYRVIVHDHFDHIDQLTGPGPDLILLDEWLYGTPGHQVCQMLKKNETTHHIPVVLLSAVNNIAQIARDCQADGHIEKPFDLSSLTSGIRAALGQ